MLFALPLLIACGGSEPAATSDASHAKTAEHGEAGHGEKGHAHGADGKAKDGHAHGEEGHGHDHGDNAVTATEKPPENGRVFFKHPEDGAKVSSPVKIAMGVEGMDVQPAGRLESGTGHHHIIIDASAPGFGEAVPADEQHIHFGKGQTEAAVELTPGEHKLTLQFADGMHRSYGEQLSTTITVTVGE
jgi:hypothetical protein